MSLKTLILMQGVPGAGKTQMAELLAAHYNSVQPYMIDREPVAVICSTDLFREGPNGEYDYRSEMNGEYHRRNMQKVVTQMEMGRSVIIVDNTNITRKSARPYVSFAEAFGYDVQVVRVSCNVDEAINRQDNRPEDRRVPADVIRRMAATMEDLTEEL